MYFPYLIARGEEAEAIIATICTYKDNNIIPILEPYSDDEDELYSYNKLVKLIKSLIENNKSFILLINSAHDLAFLKSKFANLDKYCIHGYESHNLNYQTDHQNMAIIHRDQNQLIKDSENIKYNIFMPKVLRFPTYINQYSSQKAVFIEDGFIKHEPNSDYPSFEDFNSELCFTYKSRNVIGFGDFTILEDGFRPAGGGNQSEVTHVIHLTKKFSAVVNKLIVYHFLTTPSEESDITRRSCKTIEKAFTSQNLFYRSVGIQMIENKHPGSTSLGFYKRIGIAHHIDLMHSLI